MHLCYKLYYVELILPCLEHTAVRGNIEIVSINVIDISSLYLYIMEGK